MANRLFVHLHQQGGSNRNSSTSATPTSEKLAEQFKHGRDVYLPHLTHFIPMRDPELVAGYIVSEDALAAQD